VANTPPKKKKTPQKRKKNPKTPPPPNPNTIHLNPTPPQNPPQEKQNPLPLKIHCSQIWKDSYTQKKRFITWKEEKRLPQWRGKLGGKKYLKDAGDAG